jgi:hypothetical protein
MTEPTEDQPGVDLPDAHGDEMPLENLGEVLANSGRRTVRSMEDIMATDPVVQEARAPTLRRSPRLVQFANSVANFATTEAETLSPKMGAFVFMVHEDEPTSFEEASSGKSAALWTAAMREEMDALRRNNTWHLVQLPKGQPLVRSKWVYKVKRGADGAVERYKARLVAKGFSQKKGVNYEDNFAPVAKLPSLRVILALAAAEDWHVHQMDVTSAFLQGELKEEIYMEQPDGFNEGSGLVCRLDKPLYGLKQSPRAWNLKIHAFLETLGFNNCHGDHSVYHKLGQEYRLYIVLYVDDLIITGNSLEKLQELKSNLSSKFEMKDLGELKFYLGIKVERDRACKTLTLSQESYAKKVGQRFNLSGAKEVPTPLVQGVKLTKAREADKEVGEVPFLSAIGSFVYAAMGTRVDLAFTVGLLSQFCSQYNEEHWGAAKRAIRYLDSTSTLKLTYNGKVGTNLIGYTDSDWCGSPDDSKSTSGYIFMLAGAAVSWKSKKQSLVALSSTEAEYVAATEAAKEAIWLRGLLEELGYAQEKPTPLFCDNTSAIALVENPVLHDRTKHIKRKMHFVRDAAIQGEIELKFCGTEDQLADVLTKGLPIGAHKKLRTRLGLKTPY